MIYFRCDEFRVMVVTRENIEAMLLGRPMVSPDKTIMVAWTPDLVRLATAVREADGDVAAIMELIDASRTWPEVRCPTVAEMEKIEFPKPKG